MTHLSIFFDPKICLESDFSGWLNKNFDKILNLGATIAENTETNVCVQGRCFRAGFSAVMHIKYTCKFLIIVVRVIIVQVSSLTNRAVQGFSFCLPFHFLPKLLLL